MKKCYCASVLLVAGMLAIFMNAGAAEKIAAPKVVTAAADDEEKVSKFDTIECGRLVMKSKDGKCSIVMRVDGDSASVWVSSGKGNSTVMMRAAKDGTYIGLHPEKAGENLGCPVAIISTEKNAMIQFCDGKECRHLDVKKILELLGKKKE